MISLLSIDSYSQTIRQHYAGGVYSMDVEEGYQSAARLWRYLRET